MPSPTVSGPFFLLFLLLVAKFTVLFILRLYHREGSWKRSLPGQGDTEMRGLEQLGTKFLPNSPEPGASAAGAAAGFRSSSSQVDCHGLPYNLSLVVPAVLFVAYLASQARRSFAKLRYGRSYIMIAYYALLWFVSVLNFIWCVLQVRFLHDTQELGLSCL